MILRQWLALICLLVQKSQSLCWSGRLQLNTFRWADAVPRVGTNDRIPSKARPDDVDGVDAATAHDRKSRRDVLFTALHAAWIAIAVPSFMLLPANAAETASSSQSIAAELLSQVQQARKQLDPVPKLIEEEKWDAVRAVLIEAPLADCWAKTSRPLLTRYAEALGAAGGDELAVLEAKEDLVSHLRYLDMAVYNNVFNPITVEGKSGATKELVRSYYEDPINEFKASKQALDELIGLSGGLGL